MLSSLYIFSGTSGSSNITPISEDAMEDDQDDLEPRTSILFTRSFSAPISTLPIPIPPPPPPPPTFTPTSIQNTPMKVSIKTRIPKLGFAVTSSEIQKQLSNLKKVETLETKVIVQQPEHQREDLINILKKVIGKRRESWYNEMSSGSNASSGRVSRCSSVKRLSAKSWSGDEI